MNELVKIKLANSKIYYLKKRLKFNLHFVLKFTIIIELFIYSFKVGIENPKADHITRFVC